jgi:hypothetical protein
MTMPARDFAKVVGKVLAGREAARFAVKMQELEAPTGGLASAVLAQKR